MRLSAADLRRRAHAVRSARQHGVAPAARVVRAPAGYYRPWWAQRAAAALERAPGATFLLGVAGRGGGKTRHVLYRVLRRAALRPGGATLCVWPDFPRAQLATDDLRAMAVPLGGEWQEQKKRLVLRNGHVLWVKSVDDPDSPRSLHVSALLVDEAALVSEDAWTAALGCLVGDDVVVWIATTPKGRASWVYVHWRDVAMGQRADTRRWMFRTQDSPYGMSAAVLASARRSSSADRAAQEYDAAFTEDRGAPFPVAVIDRMFSRPLAPRGERLVLGLDVAKEKDWMVAALMNEHGEAWLRARWQHVGYPASVARVTELANAHAAQVVVDTQAGGGAGSVVADYLETALGKARVLRVKTGHPGTKAKLVEELAAEAEHDVVRVDPEGEIARQARHELTFFASRREVVHGVEVIRYEGPQTQGEHDDCVIALCLANHGRVHGAPVVDRAGDGGIAGFAHLARGERGPTPGARPVAHPPSEAWVGSGAVGGAGGYFFR